MMMFLTEQNDLALAMAGEYKLELVVLSYIIASIASHTALSVSDRFRESETENRALWLLMGSVSLGLGIWAMHFVGMLAFSLPVAVSYRLSITLVSVIPAILASAMVIWNLSHPNWSTKQLIVSGFLMGIGIAVMHYVGMTAMQMTATMAYDPVLFVLSLVVAISLATLALYSKAVTIGRASSQYDILLKIFSSMIMGAAIAGMHYTSMWSVYFFPSDAQIEHSLTLPATPLGVVITIIAALVLLIAQIASHAAHERDIVRATAAAQASVENLKNQFMSTVTHELLTPLHGMNLSLSLMEKNENRQNEAYVEMARRSAAHMQRLINSMIVYTNARRGALNLSATAFQPRAFLDSLSCSESELLSKFINLKFACTESVPEWVYIDKNKLGSVLVQLIDNAVKFTGSGEIEVLCDTSNDGKLLCFSIIDSGEGMSVATRSNVFDAFYQGDNSNERRYGGLGIGLSIVKDILNVMDGQLEVESVLGEGSTFKITVPLSQPSREQIAKATKDEAVAPSQLRKVRPREKILVVEDNPVNRMLLEKTLESLNYNILSASNGEEAVDLIEHQDEITAVLMDCQMPILDGFGATQKIRKKFDSKQLPIIAISANISDINRDRCLAAGMNDFLPKPVTREVLEASLGHWLTQKAS